MLIRTGPSLSASSKDALHSSHPQVMMLEDFWNGPRREPERSWSIGWESFSSALAYPELRLCRLNVIGVIFSLVES